MHMKDRREHQEIHTAPGPSHGCPWDRRLRLDGGERPDLRRERGLRAGGRAEPGGCGGLLLALRPFRGRRREVARTFNAPIARISADYPLDFSGQGNAVSDANAGELPRIEVGPNDLDPVRRLFLVSPIWMFRPATPLWAYVEQANLTGKEIVLVTTGNSRFEQTEIDAFARRVEARGGRLTQHLFLRRGRIYWQKSREDLLAKARARIRDLR
jgi:hypothetical protein